MRHTQPVGGGELYAKLGVSPHEEWDNITRNFGAKKHNYREYGRLLLIDGSTNRVNYMLVQTVAYARRLKKKWNDYDLGSRIRSQKNKLLNRFKSRPLADSKFT
jgi:hypothetical protein